VPLYEDRETLESAYERAERAGEPFFAIEQYEEGYAITYDLLPAERELSKPARKELTTQLDQQLESVVGNEARPTAEVSKSISESLGSISFFQRESTAREVAALISRFVLDEDNWVAASPDGGVDFRQN
jgi:hypothetical protein